jgi:hypothetical protein
VEVEDEEDVGAPGSNARDRGQLSADLGVLEMAEALELE